MRSLVVKGIALSLVTGLSGCSDDQPRLNDFTAYLQREAAKTCGKQCSFVSVSKTDGRLMEVMGAKYYEMMVNISLRAEQDLSFGTGSMSGWVILGGPNATADRLQSRAKQGDAFVVPVRLKFQKFESGWKIRPVDQF